MRAVLFPADVLRPRRPDPHFRAEAEACQEAGVGVALVDHDSLQRGDVAAALGRTRLDADDVQYRGWMVTPGVYAQLDRALTERGATLRTGFGAFARCHHLPGWYSVMSEHTAESVWTSGDDRAGFERALQQLGEGPAVLKDYSKSEKRYWEEAMFIPDVEDTDHAWKVASRFRGLRGDWFDGGFVLRRWERYQPGEARTWWTDGRCVGVTAHPDDPDQTPGPVDTSYLGTAVSSLGNPFLTVDLACPAGAGGTVQWRVVEVGDGQVSDRPASLDPAEFVRSVLLGGR